MGSAARAPRPHPAPPPPPQQTPPHQKHTPRTPPWSRRPLALCSWSDRRRPGRPPACPATPSWPGGCARLGGEACARGRVGVWVGGWAADTRAHSPQTHVGVGVGGWVGGRHPRAQHTNTSHRPTARSAGASRSGRRWRTLWARSSSNSTACRAAPPPPTRPPPPWPSPCERAWGRAPRRRSHLGAGPASRRGSWVGVCTRGGVGRAQRGYLFRRHDRWCSSCEQGLAVNHQLAQGGQQHPQEKGRAREVGSGARASLPPPAAPPIH